MAESTASTVAAERARAPRLGLSGKLLVLTVLFVMMAEVLIYVPSVANFRLNWLHDRLSAAYTATLVFQTAPDGVVPERVARPPPGGNGRGRGGAEKGEGRPRP